MFYIEISCKVTKGQIIMSTDCIVHHDVLLRKLTCGLVFRFVYYFILRKHVYYILKILPPKTEIFQIKILIFFIFLLKNIDCGYLLEPPQRGGSNKYPQSMVLSRSKKNTVYPCKPKYYYIKVGFKGVKLYRHVSAMTFL